jgi:hypothetical protein
VFLETEDDILRLSLQATAKRIFQIRAEAAKG